MDEADIVYGLSVSIYTIVGGYGPEKSISFPAQEGGQNTHKQNFRF